MAGVAGVTPTALETLRARDEGIGSTDCWGLSARSERGARVCTPLPRRSLKQLIPHYLYVRFHVHATLNSASMQLWRAPIS